jgi:hypothetical protein
MLTLVEAKLDGLLSGLTKAMGGPVIGKHVQGHFADRLGARDIESLDVEGLIADLIKQLGKIAKKTHLLFLTS